MVNGIQEQCANELANNENPGQIWYHIQMSLCAFKLLRELFSTNFSIDVLPDTDAIMFRNAVWDTGCANIT